MSSLMQRPQQEPAGGSKMKGALRRIVGRQKKPTTDQSCVNVLDTQGDVKPLNEEAEISSSELQRYLTNQEKLEKKDDDSPPTSGQPLIESIFAGAPQFSLKKTDHRNIPTVNFPWDFSLEVRDASDCLSIQHPAFSASTTYSHLVPQYEPCKHAAEYGIGINEVPNMLHATGREPGTIGFVHFLEEPFADSLIHQPSLGIQKEASQTSIIQEKFRHSPETMGIRSYNAEVIAEHLKDLGKIYRDYCQSDGKTHLLKDPSESQVYSKLFTDLLTPPEEISKEEDPTGLKVQIKVLIDLLNLRDIWFDFSSAEWRFRLGALLWPLENDTKDNKGQSDDDRPLTDRHVVILQLTLACELLLRLDAVAAVTVDELYDDLKMGSDSIAEFESRETKKSKWDLWLARYFLRHTEATLTKRSLPAKSEPQLAPKFSILALLTPQREAPTEENFISDVTFIPRQTDVQLEGLLKFARLIGWEDTKSVEKQVRASLADIGKDSALPLPISAAATGLTTPRSVKDQGSEYFDAGSIRRQTSTRRVFDLPALSPAPQKENEASKSSVALGGWLTRAYLTGVVLPGEGISHYLISTLLENDTAAIAKLGDATSLYSGFTYRGKSWWSKSCIVGRVLGGLKDSKECMGWIKTNIAPDSITDSWIDVRSEPIVIKGEPRIRDADALIEAAAFVPEDEIEGASADTFTLPADMIPEELLGITFDGLSFESSSSEQAVNGSEALDNETENTRDLEPQWAMLRFSCQHRDQQIKIPLKYLVSFVSGYPCFPPKDLYGTTFGEAAATFTGHALHKSYNYRTLAAQDLFSETASSSSSVDRPADATGAKDGVLVIDATQDDKLALFARAWCAWKGKHAIIGRAGTTCLACCIIEARVLDVEVVIRIG